MKIDILNKGLFKKVFFIMIGFSSFIYADFNRENGIVTDNKTGLVWQDDYNDNAGNIKNATWREAISYCEALSLSNQTDWRLANKKELLSIIDYTKDTPAVDPIFLNIDTNKYRYWTSTTSAQYVRNAFFINMNTGHTGIVESENSKDNSHYVRCVRAGQ